MMRMRKVLVRLVIVVFWTLSSGAVFSASLPTSTQEMLKKLNLDPSILHDLDQELAVPGDWIEKARKEGRVRVQGTPGEAREERVFFAPFRERYPFINLEYAGTSQQDRAVKTLMAFRAGRILGEIVESLSGAVLTFVEAGALEDLRPLPSWEKIIPASRDANGLWANLQRNYWCISYNTQLVKKEDLPNRWEDLLKNPRWKGGNLALANRPSQWALQIWRVKGEEWTKDFLTQVFTEIKPQLRKEGTNTLPQLVAAGEFHAVIPSMAPHVSRIASEGAPVGYHCPEPVPATLGGSGILKGAPNANAARLLMNWLMSKEGQIARYATFDSTPSHKDLQRKEFLPFPEEVLGKQVIIPEPAFQEKTLPELNEFWNNLWQGVGAAR